MAALGALVFSSVPGTAFADPTPSARDVQRGKEKVRERAAEVGRTKARLAQANGELERLSADSALAVERYHGERVKLERARAAYQTVQARLAEAGRRIAVAKAELAVFAAEAYRTGGTGNIWPAVVAGPDGPQGFMDRAGMVEMLARRRAGAVEKVQAAINVAEVFQRQAQTAYDEQRSAMGRADEARRTAERAVVQQQDAVQRIEARKGVLERRLGGARVEAARLEREREAALERAEQAQVPVSSPIKGSSRGSVVVRSALKWLGTPYSWGGGTAGGPSYGIAHGSGIFGFDCSGLALYAWSKAGVRLDHWTGTQWTSGPRIPFNRLRAGDLVFFANNTSDPDTIHHVGIFIGGGRMVEAPYTGSRVRVASIWRNSLIGAVRPSS